MNNRFEYIALDMRGKESAGVLDAINREEAIDRLRHAGYYPTSVELEGHSEKVLTQPKLSLFRRILNHLLPTSSYYTKQS